ncbi:C1 family peptidase [Parabacteroides sp. FAFU027]|uniref:C1 family peptidase n=1 Tax=Parabacteroides sp. FAFU027 TaxID=2922715 RepID=UPI001FB035C7|nr:C1 family peptidase [Parabacteroides sp. FAFU027]
MNALYKKVVLTETNKVVGTGWLPPLPDLRDYSIEHPEIKEMGKLLGITAGSISLPAMVDLRQHCSPVEDQGNLGSCSAHAGIGIIEYFESKAFGNHIEGSRLFLYKTTRNLMQVTGDSGAWLRSVMSALCLCGVPDEKYWPYNVVDFDNEPTAFVYAVADNYEAIKYFCHDPQGVNTPPSSALTSVKQYLAAGIPSMFGFWGFPSFDNTNVIGGIPYPCIGEKAEWGHAIVAVGYDDKKKIRNTKCNKETTGALLIRNSWGSGWGDKGYGWLPYEYVLNKLAMDFWSLLSMEYVNTKQFGI